MAVAAQARRGCASTAAALAAAAAGDGDATAAAATAAAASVKSGAPRPPPRRPATALEMTGGFTGIQPNEYHERRCRLQNALPRNSLALVPAAPLRMHSKDIEYLFRQDTEILHLTGLNEPEAVAALWAGDPQRLPRAGAAGRFFALGVRPRDAAKETWNGPRCGVESAPERFGAQEAFPFRYGDVAKHLAPYIAASDRLFFDRDVDPRLAAALDAAGIAVHAEPIQPLMSALRFVKSGAERRLLAHACQVGSAAMVAAMRATRRARSELDLEAVFEYRCKRAGARRPSFSTVSACGEHALTLHHLDNDGPLVPGKLVLVDAGCEFMGYCSDITRTWPVDGVFTRAQRAVYNLVLHANESCITYLRSTRQVTLQQLHELCLRVIANGLPRLGVDEKHAARFMVHTVGHYLGMDVHDIHDLGMEYVLQTGSVITIEPGLYFPKTRSVPEELHGIGVRIEDNILVTDTSAVNLTDGVPKKVGDIEALLATHAAEYPDAEWALGDVPTPREELAAAQAAIAAARQQRR